MSATHDAGVARSLRTAAATEANRRRRAERAALDVAMRLELLDDARLVALAAVVVAEIRKRGAVWRDLDDYHATTRTQVGIDTYPLD